MIHLAARAGVRPSLAEPILYEEVNCIGTLRLLEAARRHGPANFVFASSSSVYGINKKVPFSEDDAVDQPISPYATTKRAGELLCFNYHHLYGLRTSCLRFFTVYGPAQRPEMAIDKFTDLLARGKTVPLFGTGQTRRDYTYVDDIVDGVVAALDLAPASRSSTSAARRRRRSSTSCTGSPTRSPSRPGSRCCPSSRATCRSPSPTSGRPAGCWATLRRYRSAKASAGSPTGTAAGPSAVFSQAHSKGLRADPPAPLLARHLEHGKSRCCGTIGAYRPPPWPR